MTIRDATPPPFTIYNRNGGSLPSQVVLIGGEGTALARSRIHSPLGENLPPEALIDVVDRTRHGEMLRVPQWVDEQHFDPHAAEATLDWVEAIVRDSRLSLMSSSPEVAAVFARLPIPSYSIDFSIDTPGETRPETRQFFVNPSYSPAKVEMRTNAVIEFPCEGAGGPVWLRIVKHEARHSYADWLHEQDLGAPDEIWWAPDNDDDRDFLLDLVPICPCNILVDSLSPRAVCNAVTNTILPDRTFSGDADSDDPFEANYAQEMDAYGFQ